MDTRTANNTGNVPALPHVVSVSEPPNPTYAYVGAFVDELRRSGLEHVVICPGSRSTPLALVFAATPAIRPWMHIDERSAAFFALGLAKSLEQPVALVCTSGTAAANFLPAIAEAHLTHVPLLILTADRPPELREVGAPQTIDQNRIYGTHVKWFMECALPEATNDALRYIRTLACRTLARTFTMPTGPVHLNMPFREPLTPAPIPGQPLPPEETRDPLAWHGRTDDRPYVQVERSWYPDTLIEEKYYEVASQIVTSPHGLILAGRQTDPEMTDQLLQLARRTGYPILADPLSQLRGAGQAEDLVISSYDAFLRSERFLARYEPQLILRFGAMPTSKPVLLYLKRYAHCPQVLIDPHQESWEEPTQLASTMIYASVENFSKEILTFLDYPSDGEHWLKTQEQQTLQQRKAWTTAWRAADHVTRAALSSAIQDLPALFEGRVFSELAELLPARSLLFAGNSMPIRDMDTFFWPTAHTPYCMGNRGANGIDGVISSALGASAGNPERHAVLVIGDLSFFHDLNGLLAARLHGLNLTIILINNDGGGIFSFLPQAAYPEHFEQLFGTPTGLDFRPVVEMYGGAFRRVTSWEEFRQELVDGLNAGGLRVIELPTERASNVSMHRQLWQVTEQALERAGLLTETEA